MRTTIDAAGRVVIPKALRDQVGLRQGEVEIEAVGADIRLRPVGDGDLVEEDGWLVIPSSGEPLTDDDVRALRFADQR
jgi:AbrB family looped-hinge helix DNA binding protein